MKPVYNTPGPATGKQASELLTRRVAARPGAMPDGQGRPWPLRTRLQPKASAAATRGYRLSRGTIGDLEGRRLADLWFLLAGRADLRT